jgi:lipoate-protein ligase A
MALDEAILTLVGEAHSPPTLRFYDWSTPWISVGSGQLANDLDPILLAQQGRGTVRRASGGTAVLHQGQLGYALILPIDDPVWQGDLVASYERLSIPFALAFASLGVTCAPAPPGENARFTEGAPALTSRACFGALGPYELLANGQKIIGNAQVRRRHSATQHGVIQVSGDQSDLADVVATESAGEREELKSYLGGRVGSLEAAAGHAISLAQLAEAIIAALVETLGIETEIGVLDDRERALAEKLVETKYGNASWTYRR